jgi:hypothetical protein
MAGVIECGIKGAMLADALRPQWAGLTAAVVQTGAHLKLVVPAVAGNYDDDLADGKLTGTWTQGPRSWPLVLLRK